ncbi:J domain-containing protein [Clostridium hydrogeniformans]|uniref:J domain-containing protein n=1 Tax=Clostridium hydrogeniformans TaxID=349933 RepID=UPI000482EDC5|nr:DnaJ domain-containing protein [Clostridium hydrogeniformans]
MKNPYEVLEINSNASQEEIKRAYKELAKKYHPDQYGNNPLRELAEEKMRELNEAYDYLMKNSSNSNFNGGNSNSNYNNNNVYMDIRQDIQRGDYFSAENKLNSISQKNAEWYYLTGIVHLKRGWHESAYENIKTASRMDPSNLEYTQALNALNNRNKGYRENYYGRRSNSNDICDTCLKLWCLDTFCECLGGDCISCL